MRRWIVAIACALPVALAAQPPRDSAPPASPTGILDPRLPVKPLDDALKSVRRTRQAAPAMERYEAGDYYGAAQAGLEVLAAAPDQPALRFAVANSLAWTGRYDPALEQYRQLLDTEYAARARIGIANILRWGGQPDLAESHYLAVLQQEPANEEARAGLRFARRELRPSLTAQFSRAADNQDFARDELALSYRRWSEDRSWRFEAGALAERNDSRERRWWARGLHGSVWAPRLPLSPRLEASLYDSDLRDAQWFGNLQIEPVRDRLRVRAGRVNWGRLSFTEAAAADGLTARTLGLFGEAQLKGGVVRGRLDGYDISDGNRVYEGEVQLSPAWQPLPAGLQWFGGTFLRRADREDPRYWSPHPTYGLAFLGLRRGWYFDDFDFSASLRGGAGFTDTARTSWSAGLNGRYWISRDVAIGFDAWAVDAPRPASYRMHQVAAFVQHLW